MLLAEIYALKVGIVGFLREFLHTITFIYLDLNLELSIRGQFEYRFCFILLFAKMARFCRCNCTTKLQDDAVEEVRTMFSNSSKESQDAFIASSLERSPPTRQTKPSKLKTKNRARIKPRLSRTVGINKSLLCRNDTRFTCHHGTT